MAFDLSAIGSQFLVGLSRSMILFIVTAGLSFVLGVLRVPNVAHGSLYMIGAFSAFSITNLVPGAEGFWLALVLAPLVVAAVSFIAERALFCHLYQREHLMLLLFTFALSLILGDLVKIIWGAEYKGMLYRWGLFAHRPLDAWVAGRVALLGDAAHGMPPFLGQGAAMAIEDGVVLGRAFAIAA